MKMAVFWVVADYTALQPRRQPSSKLVSSTHNLQRGFLVASIPNENCALVFLFVFISAGCESFKAEMKNL
jgi:hypothetical protein